MVPTLQWREEEGILRLLDQRKLPHAISFFDCRDPDSVATAIRQMVVRGAPAIGIAAAYGVALEAREALRMGRAADLSSACERLAATRPTAVNLVWALQRMKRRAAEIGPGSPKELAQALTAEAIKIHREDLEMNRAIGRHGAPLLNSGDRVLTHCNAGALATGGYGTALGVIRAAWEEKKKIAVFAGETRPVLQGARLTAWELAADGIPVTLITDSMAGFLMKKGRIQLCIVGADRIAANGDVANKIGTYTVAVLAKEHRIPFYVAAPSSTLDLSLPDGEAIPIEERDPKEITEFGGVVIAADVPAFNPAFDVTPARFITGIITERGVFLPGEIAAAFRPAP